MSSGLNIEIEGFPELVRKIQDLADDRSKKKEILGLLRSTAGATVKAARAAAPVSPRKHLISGKRTRRMVSPGNLKKSIGTITGRKGSSATEPTIYVGPRTKGANDGFYGNFVESGHRIGRRVSGSRSRRLRSAAGLVSGKFFMKKAYDQTKGQVTQESEKKVARYIQRRIDILSRR